MEREREREGGRLSNSRTSNRELLESIGKKQGEVWNERQMPKWVPVFLLCHVLAYSFPQRWASFYRGKRKNCFPHLRHHMFRETVKFSNRNQAFFYAYQLGLIKDAPPSHPHTSSSKSHNVVQIRSIFLFFLCTPRFEGSNWYSHIIPIFLDHIGLVRSTDGVCFLTPPDKLSAAPRRWLQAPLYAICKTFKTEYIITKANVIVSNPAAIFWNISCLSIPSHIFFCCRSHLKDTHLLWRAVMSQFGLLLWL